MHGLHERLHAQRLARGPDRPVAAAAFPAAELHVGVLVQHGVEEPLHDVHEEHHRECFCRGRGVQQDQEWVDHGVG